MMDTVEEIIKRLSVLAGLKVSGVGRAADMLTVQFGPLVSWISLRGTTKLVGTWALHIQCPWRIESAGAFLTGKSDLYESGSKSSEFGTLMDEKIDALIGWTSGITVDATLPSNNPIVVQGGGGVQTNLVVYGLRYPTGSALLFFLTE